MRSLPVLLVALAFPSLSCGGDPDDEMGVEPDGQTILCGAPDIAPEWLETMQSDVVGKLSGAEPISTGVTLSDRSGTQARARTQLYLEEELRALGYDVQVQQFQGSAPGSNIYVERMGEGPGTYIFGAHYDSVADSPGANDNATGVAAVLATARMLKDQEDCLQNGVMFAFFDQEERGLVGSRAFAAQLVTLGTDVRGVITVDQLGWDEDGDRRMEVEVPATGMLSAFRETIERRGLDVEVVETDTVGSDHTAFREQGFAAMGITEEYVSGDTTPHYHLSSDTFETVNIAYLSNSTRVLAAHLSDLVLK